MMHRRRKAAPDRARERHSAAISSNPATQAAPIASFM